MDRVMVGVGVSAVLARVEGLDLLQEVEHRRLIHADLLRELVQLLSPTRTHAARTCSLGI